MLQGIVTNTSIMANMDDAETSLELLRANGLIERVGLHVNLTEGRPLSSPADIPSLLDVSRHEDPHFMGKAGFYEACQTGKVCIKHVQTEVRAQLQWFIRNIGHPPVHVDSHQHVHVLPPLVDMLAALFF
jgi:predicted glycoside hydrolase/deacetylase ChbG (UPF0249 family)